MHGDVVAADGHREPEPGGREHGLHERPQRAGDERVRKPGGGHLGQQLGARPGSTVTRPAVVRLSIPSISHRSTAAGGAGLVARASR